MSKRKTKHFNSLNQIIDVWPNQWGLFWFLSRWWLEEEVPLKFRVELLTSQLHLAVITGTWWHRLPQLPDVTEEEVLRNVSFVKVIWMVGLFRAENSTPQRRGRSLFIFPLSDFFLNFKNFFNFYSFYRLLSLYSYYKISLISPVLHSTVCASR